MKRTRTSLTVLLAGLVAAPVLGLASPAAAHVPGVAAGPVKAGCSDAAVQPVRRNGRGQVVEQLLLRATVTSPTAHTHVVDRQLRVSNRHTGKLSGWRTVAAGVRVACGRGSGSTAISGTVSSSLRQAGVDAGTQRAGVAWKLGRRLTAPAPTSTDTTLVLTGHDWT